MLAEGDKIITAGRDGARCPGFTLPNGQRASRPLFTPKEYVVHRTQKGHLAFKLSRLFGESTFSLAKAERQAEELAERAGLPYRAGIIQWDRVPEAPAPAEPIRGLADFNPLWS